MQIYRKKREGNRKKKVWPVLRFEPPTAYMWIMYDNHHAMEVIINKCRFFGLNWYALACKLVTVYTIIYSEFGFQ